MDREELWTLMKVSEHLKTEHICGVRRNLLKGKTLGMIFQKPSTRTRVSFEVAMEHLGGRAIYLGWQELQLGRGETVGDTAKVLSRYLDGIMARVYEHSLLEELARNSSVPVINGLSDDHHPVQAISDLFTIIEKKGWDVEGLKLAYVGDGNNVCNSLIEVSALSKMEMWVATPKGYEPNEEVLMSAERIWSGIHLTNDPIEAVRDADVIYTDVWVSMGMEEERQKRLRDFSGYQVNSKLVSHAKEEVIVMHCLPAHRGEEISNEVMDGPNSVVFDQAENRLHVQKGLLVLLLGK